MASTFQASGQHGNGPLHVVMQRPLLFVARTAARETVSLSPQKGPSLAILEHEILTKRLQIESLLPGVGNEFPCGRPLIVNLVHAPSSLRRTACGATRQVSTWESCCPL